MEITTVIINFSACFSGSLCLDSLSLQECSIHCKLRRNIFIFSYRQTYSLPSSKGRLNRCKSVLNLSVYIVDLCHMKPLVKLVKLCIAHAVKYGRSFPALVPPRRYLFSCFHITYFLVSSSQVKLPDSSDLQTQHR